MIGLTLVYNLVYKANPDDCQQYPAQAKAYPVRGHQLLGCCSFHWLRVAFDMRMGATPSQV